MMLLSRNLKRPIRVSDKFCVFIFIDLPTTPLGWCNKISAYEDKKQLHLSLRREQRILNVFSHSPTNLPNKPT